jgi:hypothetical protein
MDKVFSILALHKVGWSDREIASELGIHRETVGRHIRLAEAGSKPATDAPTGSEVGHDAPPGSDEESKPARDAPTGSAAIGQAHTPMNGGFIALLPTAGGDKLQTAVAKDTALLGSNRSVAAVPYGTGGPDSIGTACLVHPDNSHVAQGVLAVGYVPGHVSQCERFRDVIEDKFHRGLTAQRIYQDLVADERFDGSYYSVRRFVGKLTVATEVPFRRMECSPGAEAQVDFGKGATVVEPGQRRRRPHVLRVVLSHSRKGYSEVVCRRWRSSGTR